MKSSIYGLAAAALVFAGSQAFADDCCCHCDRSSNKSSSIDWSVSTYAGAGLQFSKFNEWSLTDRYDDGSFTAHSKTSDGAGYRLFGGVNFLRYFGIEAGYTDSGEASSIAESDGSGSLWAAGPISESVSSQGWDLSLIGRVPVIANFKLYGKGGSNYRSTHSNFSGAVQCGYPGCGGNINIRAANTDRFGWLYGVGVEYSGLRRVQLAAGYVATQADYGIAANEHTIDSISMTAAYPF